MLLILTLAGFHCDQKYILGMKADYKELTEAPVSEGTQTSGDAPKVEEISEDEYKAVKAKEQKKAKAAKKEEEETKPDPNDID